MDTLSDRIKKTRESSGLTQSSLADKIGISLRTMRSYEKDAVHSTVTMVQKIAYVCGVNDIWLLTGNGNMLNDSADEKPNSDKPDTVFSLGPVVKAHMDAVKKFKNPDTAYQMTQDMLEIEEKAPDAYEKAVVYIKGIKVGISSSGEKKDASKKPIPSNGDTARKKTAS